MPPFDSTGVAGMNHSLRDIIVDALGVGLVVGIGRGDAREQILVGFAGQQIAVAQRVLAEFGQQRVAASSVTTSNARASTVLLVALRASRRGDVVAR